MTVSRGRVGGLAQHRGPGCFQPADPRASPESGGLGRGPPGVLGRAKLGVGGKIGCFGQNGPLLGTWPRLPDSLPDQGPWQQRLLGKCPAGAADWLLPLDFARSIRMGRRNH